MPRGCASSKTYVAACYIDPDKLPAPAPPDNASSTTEIVSATA